MKTIISAVGNFCMYPRTGELIASPVNGWPRGWTRAAKALGLETSDGGVVVGSVQGYGPHHSKTVENHPNVERILEWLSRHPEASGERRCRIPEGITLEKVGEALRRCVQNYREHGHYFEEWPRTPFHFRWAIDPPARWTGKITPSPLP